MRDKVYNSAIKTISLESEEVANLKNTIDNDFIEAVVKISQCKGKVIVTGMGKSGLIGRKIAATLSSTGTPSFFLHPAEAFHGDLGVISDSDILLALSYSGETDEVLQLIPSFKKNQNFIIGITRNPESTLGVNSNLHIVVNVEKEACPLSLAPTSSTTATLVLGDALAVALMEYNGFRKEQFAEYHPGGSLGRKLLMSVRDVMKKDVVPIAKEDDNILKVVKQVTKGKLGMCLIGEKEIKGIITDGDLRRAMEEYKKSFFDLLPKDIMTKSPIIVKEDTKLAYAQELMIEKKIGTLLVGCSSNVTGLVQIYDLGI
jgi:arabinose-5-phosphate isomerase